MPIEFGAPLATHAVAAVLAEVSTSACAPTPLTQTALAWRILRQMASV